MFTSFFNKNMSVNAAGHQHTTELLEASPGSAESCLVLRSDTTSDRINKYWILDTLSQSYEYKCVSLCVINQD